MIFEENLIRKRLLDLNSPSRIVLKDELFTPSAILFLIIKHEKKSYELVLIRRTIRDTDKHSGEMSFPGGRVDPLDNSLEETALRECEEELGISRKEIKILGCFDDHITPKGYIMTPVVGYIEANQSMNKQDEEVHEIVKIPIDYLVNKKNYRERIYTLNGDMIAVGKYNYRDSTGKRFVIFGATCHVIVNYIELVYDMQLMKLGARRLSCADIRDKIAK